MQGVTVVEVPQWQASGSRTAYRLRRGAAELADFFPSDERLRADTENQPTGVRDGVTALDTLAANLHAIRATLARAHGSAVITVGGDCAVDLAPIEAALNRHGDRLAVVWFDAHGDLNTPETSPSGNLWGMPLRMAIDEGSVRTEDVALVGARDLDLPEQEYVAEHGIDDDLARALRDTDAAYVALDVDVLEPGTVSCFMPAPGGLDAADVERLLLEIASSRRVAGMGLTGLAPGADPAVLARFAAMAGL